MAKGWTENTACALCGVYDESVDHLFTQCVLIKFIMVSGLDDVQPEDLGDDVHVVWDR